jgi:RimJ/RimL family protein N-acetyltransferase
VDRADPPIDRFETIDGVELLVRPIGADDKAALVDAFRHLSRESVYKRFLAPVKRLTESELAYLTQLDHSDHEALVAVTEADEIVGVARYVRQPGDPKRAEVAVTVRDEWQGRGVGTALLRLLAGRGTGNGVEQFTGVCLAENREMLQLFDELGPSSQRRADGDVIEVEVRLPTTATQAIRPALRAAARAWSG